MEPGSCLPGASRPRTRRTGRPRNQSFSSRSAGCRWSWSGSKKVSAALMPMNYASWSITTIPSSASAAKACCWGCLDPRCTTGPHRCGNRCYGSWQGSMLSIWKIPAAVAAGWWPIWPEMRSRSAVIGCETSCAAWGYGRSTRNPAPQFPGIPPSVFHVWWISAWSRYLRNSSQEVCSV